MAQANSGTNNTPPIRNPSMAKAMAIDRLRLNQLFSTVIIGIHVPRPAPMLITTKEA